MSAPVECWAPDTLEHHDFPGLEHVVAPWLPTESIAVIFGNREAGKTQLCLTMLKCAERGELLLGRWRVKMNKMGLIEVDMPARMIQARLKIMAAVHRFDPARLRLWTMPSLNIMRCDASTPWVEQVNAWGPDVLVFDSLRKIHAYRENDTDAPSAVYGKLRELFPQKTFCLPHHMKKPPPAWLQAKEQYDPADDEETYRGTTAWIDDANVAVHVYRQPKTYHRLLRVTRSQQCDDSVKRSHISFQLTDHLFVEPTEPTAEMLLLDLKVRAPDTKRREAVEWLLQQSPFKRYKESWAYDVVASLGVFEAAKPGPKPRANSSTGGNSSKIVMEELTV